MSWPICKKLNMFKLLNRGLTILIRPIGIGFLTLALCSCAAERLHEEGMNLVDAGQAEQGLKELEQAAKTDPENFSYRIDVIHTRERVLNRMLQQADSQRAIGNADLAEKLYQRVLKIDKDNPSAKAGLHNLEMDRRHASAIMNAQKLFDQHRLERAQTIARGVLMEDPNYQPAKLIIRKIDEQLANDAVSGPTLNPKFKKPVTLEFRDANLKMVVEALSRTSGLNILLDKDVRSDLKTTIFVKNASVEDTVDLIALQDGLNKKILSDNTILLYPDTASKVKQYQDLIVRSFELTNADPKEMEKMLKTVLKTKDMYVDAKTNSLVIRDTPDAIQLAEKLIKAHDLVQPEVMLEVEVLEVTRARLTELGIKLPEQIALSAAGTPPTTTVNTLPGGGVVTTTTPSQPLTLRDLGHLNSNYFTASALNASIDLKDESGDVNILASPRIRVRNRQDAKILIGDRVPVITNAVTPVASGTPVVTGNVQYLDVGLKLDVKPDIHPDDDVEIKVNLEVSSIVREISSGPTLAYQIGTRSANTVLRLKDGETQVLAGLISDEDRKAAQKFPGLGDLPILGRLFSSHKDDKKKTEIVLSITPHLTRRNVRPDAKNLEFWSGTDGNLRSRPITLEPIHIGPTSETTAPLKKTSYASLSQQSVEEASKAHKAVTKSAPINKSAAPPKTIKSTFDQTGQPVSMSLNGPKTARVGEEFQVTINAQTDKPISSLSFNLGYDPTTFSVIKIREGSLFKQQGNRSVFSSKIDPNTGRAFIIASQLGPRGVSGKGSVAVVTLSARTSMAKAPIIISSSSATSSTGSKLPKPTSSPLIMKLSP